MSKNIYNCYDQTSKKHEGEKNVIPFNESAMVGKILFGHNGNFSQDMKK